MYLDLKNPTVQKVLLSVLAGGALLGIFFMTSLVPFGYQNQRKAIDGLRADYDAKATELARAQATVRDLPRFEAEFEQLHERWAQTAELLPTDRQMPAVLRKLTLAAQQNGVQFVTFRPQPIRQQQNYAEMPVEVSVFGGYHQVGAFLADLANLRRIVTVSNLVLKTNTRFKSAPGTTVADLVATAYCLSSSNTPAPAPAVTPAAPAEPSTEGDGTETKKGDTHGKS